MRVKNKYPILVVVNLFDQLGEARHFTKLDLKLGNYRVRIMEEDELKATCVTLCGSYEHLVTYQCISHVIDGIEPSKA